MSGRSVAGEARSVQTDEPRQLGDTIWRVQRLFAEDQLQPDDQIIASDATGDEIARVPVRSIAEWGSRAPAVQP